MVLWKQYETSRDECHHMEVTFARQPETPWPVRLRLNLAFNLRAPTPSPMGSCGITFFFVMLIYKPPLGTSVGQSKPSYIIAPPTSTAYCLPV